MPLFADMDHNARRRTIRGINLKIRGCLATKRKLRELRDADPNITRAKELQIALELTRLQFKIDDLIDWKSAFKLNQKALGAPSVNTIQSMRDKVLAIEDMLAAETTVRQLLEGATEIAGALQPATLI